MPNYNTYDTERLYLRPTQEEDAAFILELLNSPKFIKYVGDRNVHSVGSARKYIQEKMLPQLEKLGYANYTVITKKDHKKIGTCGLYNREGIEGIDIGFAFLPNYENQGYGFEAASKIMNAGFNDFGITQINAYTTKDNMGSQRLLEKLGFTQTGTINLPNDPEELLKYQIQRGTQIVAETDRLILREFDVKDAEAFYNLNNNPEVLKFTGDDPFASISEAEQFIKNYDQYQLNGYGRWAVIEKVSGKFIGFSGLKLNEQGDVDLGFRFFQEQWGKGYATESAIACMKIGFEQYKVDAIIGRADQNNIASVKVLEKLGMSFWKYDACEHLNDAVYYRIKKSEYYCKYN